MTPQQRAVLKALSYQEDWITTGALGNASSARHALPVLIKSGLVEQQVKEHPWSKQGSTSEYRITQKGREFLEAESDPTHQRSGA